MAQEVAEMAEAEERLLGQDPDAGKESSEDYLGSASPEPTSSSIWAGDLEPRQRA